MRVLDLIDELARIGGQLRLETNGELHLWVPPAVAQQILAVYQEELTRLPCGPELGPGAWRTPDGRIPENALLVAPRFDGSTVPLAEVPSCWCCAAPYVLDHLKEWQGKTYAYLIPGCGCLDAQMLSCCGLCVEHCTCERKEEANAD